MQFKQIVILLQCTVASFVKRIHNIHSHNITLKIPMSVLCIIYTSSILKASTSPLQLLLLVNLLSPRIFLPHQMSPLYLYPSSTQRRHRSGSDKTAICQVPGCDATFYQKKNLYRHEREKHGAKLRRNPNANVSYTPFFGDQLLGTDFSSEHIEQNKHMKTDDSEDLPEYLIDDVSDQDNVTCGTKSDQEDLL